jgi:hypothetical protein
MFAMGCRNEEMPTPTSESVEPSSKAGFDRSAAIATMTAAAARAAACETPDGPKGSGRIAVTFGATGAVTTATVEGPPFAGTAVGACVEARFRECIIPPFNGTQVKIPKAFTVGSAARPGPSN